MTNHLIDIKPLLGDATRLFETLVVVREEFPLQPVKQHLAACINYADLLEMRDDFIQELVHTVVPFVYSREHQEKIVERMGDDVPQAWSRLIRRARGKFRRSDVTGQFSELLLFNVLRHWFDAAPLVRKMSITTNPEVERHGADAVHVAVEDDNYVIYLGEAKTYDRDRYGLRTALKDAVDDVVAKHYVDHRKELDLYRYEEFLPAPLEAVANAYLDGRLSSASVQVVCLASYDHRRTATGKSRDECVDAALEFVRQDIASIKADKLADGVPEALLPRFNYVCFGLKAMQDLLKDFRRELGVA